MAITRSISNVTGISLSLVKIVSGKSLGASVGVAGSAIRMVGPSRSISKEASISLPLVQIVPGGSWRCNWFLHKDAKLGQDLHIQPLQLHIQSKQEPEYLFSVNDLFFVRNS